MIRLRSENTIIMEKCMKMMSISLEVVFSARHHKWASE